MLARIRALLKHKGYELFTRPYELNIVGLRSKSVIPNRFDDELHVFYKTKPLHWEYHVFRITTDPGTYWLKNPMQPQGTAILAEGQYKNSHQIGLHRGQYEALVQRKPVTIMRDYDRNAILDFYNGKKTRGVFGINIHRANRVGTTKTIDKNSAGCQVFENASDFAVFMKLSHRHAKLYGNNFTYTLIDFRSVQRQTRRRIAYAAVFFAMAGIAGYYFTREKESKEHEQFSKAVTKRQKQQLQPA
jgi:hypothetical protein